MFYSCAVLQYHRAVFKLSHLSDTCCTVILQYVFFLTFCSTQKIFYLQIVVILVGNCNSLMQLQVVILASKTNFNIIKRVRVISFFGYFGTTFENILSLYQYSTAWKRLTDMLSQISHRFQGQMSRSQLVKDRMVSYRQTFLMRDKPRCGWGVNTVCLLMCSIYVPVTSVYI